MRTFTKTGCSVTGNNECVLVVARRERSRNRPPLGVADLLGDLVTQRTLAENREALTEIVDVAPGAGI